MTQTAKRIQQIVIIAVFFVMLIGLMLANILVPDQAISESERRPLAQLPEFSYDKLWSGKLFSEFEDYALDQFVKRDSFRSLNAHMKYNLLFQKDNNNIFIKDGTIYKMEYPLMEGNVAKNLEAYRKVIDNCFADSNSKIYYCVIPDKNFYLPESDSHLQIDYDRLFEMMKEALPEATMIDIRDCLKAEDFYKTDLHWSQPNILNVANRLIKEMGGSSVLSEGNYETVSHEGFKGSYFGQAVIKVPTDTLTYLTNDNIRNVKVMNHETGKRIAVYNEEALQDVDAYDLFLGGPKALLELRNTNAAQKKQLVIIRDSFSSSLAPLLTEEYASIILVDLRYVSSEVLNQVMTFSKNADVLFLHNSMILNQYGILK